MKKGHRPRCPFFLLIRPPRDRLKNKKIATATRKRTAPAVAGYPSLYFVFVDRFFAVVLRAAGFFVAAFFAPVLRVVVLANGLLLSIMSHESAHENYCNAPAS